ncbi:hypothetical protein JHK85_000533 [Glycine max]|uniref:Magnesium transporter MRS2-2 n=1 Tax=Glycine soja TaxID=3848 RepID=A0A0B2RYE1_GLYSO|nr:hypothetical protein JHK85_000533 [Glycine max]KHN37443.1 Magnesium transporter MRS2-2 [Glycine soja]
MSQRGSPISEPIQPNIHVLGARVSTKGSNAEAIVNPSPPNHVAPSKPTMGLYVHCQDSTELVALGKTYDGGSTIYNVAYADDVVRVSVDKVINGDTEVPFLTSEIKYVRQALHTFVAWPTTLVKLASNEHEGTSPSKVTDEAVESVNDVVVDDPLREFIKTLVDIYEKPVELVWDVTKFGIPNAAASFTPRWIKVKVLLRDPTDENVIHVVEELQRWLPRLSATSLQQKGDGKEYLGGQNDVEAAEEDESPFEFRALEVALEAICSFLAARTIELEMAISSRNLDRVRKLKSAMTRLTARVQRVRDELEQLLDDDDDMVDLYLSRKVGSSSPVSGSGAANWFAASPTIRSKISRASLATIHLDENDVEELEMLLEVYFSEIDHTLNKLTTIKHKYPTEEMKLVLAEELGLTEKQISGWFCHKRLKYKRLMKDEVVANGRQDCSSGVIQDRGSGLGQDSCGSSKHADHRYLDSKEVESHGLYNLGQFATLDSLCGTKIDNNAPH